MRFGGHETFTIREGWLYKGLKLLDKEPRAFANPYVSDTLGVGRNMAKSIRHWLQVTGLISREEKPAGSLRISELGRLILEHDPYFLEIGTWWALHIQLTTQQEEAVVWPWFFNDFTLERFDRAHCQAQLQRHLELSNMRPSSPKTLARDILCLLSSYARPIPAEPGDPEDPAESPFRDLGLLTHYRDSGHYEVRREAKNIPPELFVYCLAKTFGNDHTGGYLTIPLRDAVAIRGAPARVFALTPEVLVDTVQEAETMLEEEHISLIAIGGERGVRLKNLPPLQWVGRYYDRTSLV